VAGAARGQQPTSSRPRAPNPKGMPMVTWNDFRKWLTDHDLPDPVHAPVIKIELVPPVNLDADPPAAVYISVTAYKLDANGKQIEPLDDGTGRSFLTETYVRPLVSLMTETAE
jgi:hypothetical protein